MPRPLGQFFITDPFTTTLGWKLAPGQLSVNAVVYINNQSPQEFDIWGNGVNYLGKAPAWISYYKFTMDLVYNFVEFRPTMSLNPLGPPALYLNGIVFESTEPDPHWQPIAVVRQTDAARQIRSVAVPMGIDHWFNGTWHAADPATLNLQTAAISAAQLARSPVYAPIYCHYGNMSPESGQTGTMVFQFGFQWQDAGSGNVGGPFVFQRASVSSNGANNTASPWVFAPVWPFAAVGQAPPTAVKAVFQLIYLSGTRIDVDYNIAAWMDQSNFIGDSGIGTQAIYNALNPTLNPYF